MAHGPAVLDGPQYKYENTQFTSPPTGPLHPVPTQSAFLCLTINGVFRILFPEQKGSWHEARLELESIVSSDDLITHAAFCNERGTTCAHLYCDSND